MKINDLENKLKEIQMRLIFKRTKQSYWYLKYKSQKPTQLRRTKTKQIKCMSILNLPMVEWNQAATSKGVFEKLELNYSINHS